MTTGDRMKAIRKELDIPVEDIATALGVSVATVYRKAYDRIEIKVRKGRKCEIFAYATRQNKSVNQFIVELIDREMNR